MRTLITGINGFTGRHLESELLSLGWEVGGTCQEGFLERPGVKLYACPLEDQKGLTSVIADFRPEAVVHLAAVSFVAHGDLNEIYRTNLLGSLNLLQACAKAEVPLRKVLLASTANVYGNVDSDQIVESTPLAPVNHYGVSKLAMEQAARLWFDSLPLVIVRPFNYTGVGQASHFLIPKIVSHFQQHASVIELGNTFVSRDFSDVRRVVSIYRRLLESKVRSEVFNVCSGQVHSLDSIISSLEEIAGYKIEVRVRPEFVRSNEIVRLGGSSHKLDAAIGAVAPISLTETLRWMFEAGA